MPRRQTPLIPLLAALLALVAAQPSALSAQEAAGPELAGPLNSINGNPILYLFEWLNLEYFRVVGPSVTLGLTGDWVIQEDADGIASVMAAFRFYPEERAPRGFYVGGRLGAFSQEAYDYLDSHFGESPGVEWETNAAVSVEVGYDWLLGSNESFYLSLGAGITRVLGNETGEDFWPILRIANVGWAF